MKKTLLLGVTASIAAYKACELVRLFRKKGIEVTCVLSRDADKFVTPLTLQSLSGRKVYSDMFALPEELRVEHVSLADEADCILIAPATADIIARIAGGICDDLLSTVVCSAALRKPVIFAPAMNEHMYKNPILKDKIEYLKEKSYSFIEPSEGELVCGSKGVGCLAPLEEIVSCVLSALER